MLRPRPSFYEWVQQQGVVSNSEIIEDERRFYAVLFYIFEDRTKLETFNSTHSFKDIDIHPDNPSGIQNAFSLLASYSPPTNPAVLPVSSRVESEILESHTNRQNPRDAEALTDLGRIRTREAYDELMRLAKIANSSEIEELKRLARDTNPGALTILAALAGEGKHEIVLDLKNYLPLRRLAVEVDSEKLKKLQKDFLSDHPIPLALMQEQLDLVKKATAAIKTRRDTRQDMDVMHELVSNLSPHGFNPVKAVHAYYHSLLAYIALNRHLLNEREYKDITSTLNQLMEGGNLNSGLMRAISNDTPFGTSSLSDFVPNSKLQSKTDSILFNGGGKNPSKDHKEAGHQVYSRVWKIAFDAKGELLERKADGNYTRPPADFRYFFSTHNGGWGATALADSKFVYLTETYEIRLPPKPPDQSMEIFHSGEAVRSQLLDLMNFAKMQAFCRSETDHFRLKEKIKTLLYPGICLDKSRVDLPQVSDNCTFKSIFAALLGCIPPGHPLSFMLIDHWNFGKQYNYQRTLHALEMRERELTAAMSLAKSSAEKHSSAAVTPDVTQTAVKKDPNDTPEMEFIEILIAELEEKIKEHDYKQAEDIAEHLKSCFAGVKSSIERHPNYRPTHDLIKKLDAEIKAHADKHVAPLAAIPAPPTHTVPMRPTVMPAVTIVDKSTPIEKFKDLRAKRLHRAEELSKTLSQLEAYFKTGAKTAKKEEEFFKVKEEVQHLLKENKRSSDVIQSLRGTAPVTTLDSLRNEAKTTNDERNNLEVLEALTQILESQLSRLPQARI